MKLYLVRHGETEGNRQGRYIGWEDLPLTPAGRHQAELLQHRLATYAVTTVHSSDLIRAVTTAEAIGAPHHLTPRKDQRLREANFGLWSGMTYDEIHALDPDRLHSWIADPEAHGESLDHLRQRVLQALPTQDGAVVVTHGGPIRLLLSHWTGCSLWDVQINPGGLIMVDWDGGRIQAVQQLT